jgi:hypothetical protein
MRTALSLALSCLAIVWSATDTFLPNFDVNEAVALPSDLTIPQQLYLKANEGVYNILLKKVVHSAGTFEIYLDQTNQL